VGRGQVAARGVELDQHRRVTIGLRLGDRIVQVAGHDLVDDAARG
jgi:hypothetical protein